MSDVAGELLVPLGRTTLALGGAVCFVAIVLRIMRVSNPAVHRAGCVLALLVGWTFVRLPLAVPWYEAAADVPVSASAVLTDMDNRTLSEADDTTSSEADNIAAFVPPVLPSSPEPPAVTELDILPGAPPVVAVDVTGPIAAPTEIDAPPTAVVVTEEPSPDEDPTAEDAAIAAVAIDSAPAPATIDDAATTVATTVLPPIPATSAARAEQFARLLLGGWAVGIVAIVACWLWGYCRFVLRLPAGEHAEDQWTAEWQQLLAQAGNQRKIPLRVTAELGPMLCRLPRGYELLVPATLWRDLDARQRLCILRHELAHYQRGDVWKSLAVRVIALPHWFNPLAWRAVRRFDEAAEWACDEQAAADEPVTAYARALLRLGESARQHAAYSPAANGRTLAARIRRLLSRSPRRDSVAKNLFVGMVLGMILAAALVRVELVAREPESVQGSAAETIHPASAETTTAASDTQPVVTLDNLIVRSEEAANGAVTAVVSMLDDTPGEGTDRASTEIAHNTVVEMLRNMLLLQRVIRDPSIASLSTIKKQDDPVAWLHENLGIFYPVGSHAVTLTLRAEDGDAVEILKAVFAAYAREVVDKRRVEESQRQQKPASRLLSPELLEAAEAGYKVALSDFENDKITLHEVCAWSLRWLSAAETAELVVTTVRVTPAGPVDEETIEAPSEEERAAALRSHLARMKELQARIVALFDAGVRGGEAEKKALMNYYVADADRRLKRFEVWQKTAQRTAVIRQQTSITATPAGEPITPAVANSSKTANVGGKESAAARFLHERFGLRVEVVPKEGLSSPDRERFRGGLRVVSLDSPVAAKAGLRVGDIILGMGSNDIMRETVSLQGAATAIGLAVGSPVGIQWSRNGEQSVAEVPQASELRRETQSATPKNAVPVLRSAPVPRNPNDTAPYPSDEVVLRERLGVQVVHVPKEEFHQTPEEQFEGGLRVERANAAVEAAGLRVRDVIVGIDNTATPTVEAARTVLDRVAGRPTCVIHFRRDAVSNVIEIPLSTDAAERRRERLMKQYEAKSADLVREMHDIEQLQAKLGIVDPSDLGPQSQRLQTQLNGTQTAIYSLSADIFKADEEVDSLELDVAMAQDPAAREIRAEGELAKDERLQRLESEVEQLDDELIQARAEGKGEGDVAITGTIKRRQAVEDRIHSRREELTKKWSDANEALRVKQLQGKLALANKRRDRLQEQLVALRKDADEVREQITVLHQMAPGLQARLQRARALQTETETMNKELHTLWLQKENLAPQPGDSSGKETSQRPGARNRQGYDKLQKLAAEKKLQLEREQTEMQKLQMALGAVDLARIGEHKDALRTQSNVIKNSLSALASQLSELDVRVDQLKLDIALAQDPATKEARIEDEVRKDEKLEKLEDQLNDYDAAIAQTKAQVKGADNGALARLQRTRRTVEDKIAARRDELQKRFVDANEAVKIKELQGKLAATEKHHRAIEDQKAEQEKQLAELNQQLQLFDREAADLENRQQRVRTLGQMLQEMDRDLEKLQRDLGPAVESDN